MKIIPISEGSFTVDGSKEFVPIDLSQESLKDRARGSLLVEIQPFLVQTDKDLILLDAGLGFEEDGDLQLIRNIQKAGFNRSDVTKVLMSHLHKDHAGGLKALDKSGPALPGAKYYIHEQELNYALSDEASGYDPAQFDFLINHNSVNLLTGEGTIDDYIDYKITGGHSLYHIVFWIKENGRTVFYGGDEAPQLSQMKHRYAAKYDYDGKKAMELRAEWWEKGTAEGWEFLFYHDVKNAVYNYQQ